MKRANVFLSVSLVLPLVVLRAGAQGDDFSFFRQKLVLERKQSESVSSVSQKTADLDLQRSEDLERKESPAMVSLPLGETSELHGGEIKVRQAKIELDLARDRLARFREERLGKDVPDSDKVLAMLEKAVSDAEQKYKSVVENYRRIRDKTTKNSNWFKRGCCTFLCAPCNFWRTSEVLESTCNANGGSDGYGLLVKIASTPVVLGCEFLPVSCDLVNGLLDILSCGKYGDFIYSESLDPRWDKRDNTHFPWLDRQ